MVSRLSVGGMKVLVGTQMGSVCLAIRELVILNGSSGDRVHIG